MSELADELVDASDDVDAPTDDGAPGEPVARADEPAALSSAPTIDFDSWEVQQRVAEIADQRFREALAALPQNQPEAPTFEIDPLADNFGNQLVDLNGQLIDSKLAPLLDYVASQQQQQTDSLIVGALSEAAQAAKLDGADTGVLRAVAAHFAAQPEFARYGATEAGVKATAAAAAQWLAADRKAARDAGVVDYRKQIGEIADTPAEPSASGGGIVIEGKPKTYDEILAAHTARV